MKVNAEMSKKPKIRDIVEEYIKIKEAKNNYNFSIWDIENHVSNIRHNIKINKQTDKIQNSIKKAVSVALKQLGYIPIGNYILPDDLCKKSLKLAMNTKDAYNNPYLDDNIDFHAYADCIGYDNYHLQNLRAKKDYDSMADKEYNVEIFDFIAKFSNEKITLDFSTYISNEFQDKIKFISVGLDKRSLLIRVDSLKSYNEIVKFLDSILTFEGFRVKYFGNNNLLKMKFQNFLDEHSTMLFRPQIDNQE